MKYNKIYLLLLVVTVSCFNSSEEYIGETSSKDIIPNEIAQMMSKKWRVKDTMDYDRLVSWACLDYRLCEIDSVSRIFAFEYKHANAYVSIFYCLTGIGCHGGIEDVDLNKIDKVKLKEALEYLVIASELGSADAKDILETHFKGIAKGSP